MAEGLPESLSDTLEMLYETMEGSELSEEYSERHGIDSAQVLTVYNNESAGLIAERLSPRIEGKTVIEIGGGIGLLALHLGIYAKRVYCIEASPAWSWAFVGCLYHAKPKNVSYLFGIAEEFVGEINGDISLFCSHSGITKLKEIGSLFAPIVIDVYGEIINDDPDRFDPLATMLRGLE